MLNKNYIEKTFFFITNIFIINFLENKNYEYLFEIWLLFILIISNRNNLKKIMIFFIPTLFFLIPLIIIQGIKKDIDGIYLQIEYKFLLKNISSITAMIIYISSISFKEFCYMMKKLKIPNYLIEIVIYMKKFVAMMLINYKEYLLTYKCRNGKIKMKDFSQIIVIVFKNSFCDLQNMKLSLYSRGYLDTYNFLVPEIKISITRMCIYILYALVIIRLR